MARRDGREAGIKIPAKIGGDSGADRLELTPTPTSSTGARHPPSSVAGAPLRPRHYIGRDRLSAAAAAALLKVQTRRRGSDGVGVGSGEGGGEEGVVVAFAGCSGSGKTCLAGELVRRRDVRAKFGEGVLWLQVRGEKGGTGRRRDSRRVRSRRILSLGSNRELFSCDGSKIKRGRWILMESS